MWVGVGVICLMLIVPPYDKQGWLHYPIFVPPTHTTHSSYSGPTYRVAIDWKILSVQIAVVVMLTVAGIVTFKKRHI